MKKSVYSILAALAVVFALVSCAKEAQIPDDEVAPKEVEAVEEQEELVELTLIAGNPEAEPATKTEMSGSTPYWSKGDIIGVSTGTSGNYQFETGITEPSSTASFTGSTVSGSLYAYYPYSSDGIITENKTTGARVNLIKDQSPTATSFDGAADIMVAKNFEVDPANTVVNNLEFARLGAIVKIVLIDKDDSMTGTQYPSTVSMTANTPLAGYVIVDMINQSMTNPYYNTSTTVTASYSDETHFAINGTNGAYLIVAPQTLAQGSSLTIAAATDDYTISKTITVPDGGIELLPGKVNTLNIKLSSSHITPIADPYELYTSEIEEGDYLIVSDGVAMKASITSNRFQYTAVSISDDKIYNPDADCVWHIAASGEYWTIYNAETSKYAAGTGSKNQGALVNSATNSALWSFTYSSEWSIVNKANNLAGVNANIRRNGANGFATYAADYGTAPVLYKLNDGKSEAGIAYARSNDVITYGDALTPPALSNEHGLSVNCSSSNTNVVTVNETTGAISVVGNAGVATITVSWDEQTISTVTYRSGSTTYTLTVNKKTPTIAAFVDPPTSLAVDATVTKTTTISDGLSITYTSSDETVATVNASTGEVTGVADGTVTISATFAGNDNFTAAESKSYSLTVGAGSSGPVTVTKTINQVVSANGYTVSSGNTVNDIITSFQLDENITVSTSGNPNCGSFWGTSTYDWRLYQAQSGDITISASSGHTISKLTITYSTSNGGVLKSGGTTISSASEQTIDDATSITYIVGNSGTKTNGQVRVTQISVTYE